MIKSQTKRSPIQNFAIFIVAFLVIGMVLGPNLNQVYSGISATGSDTVELTNDGNLDTKVRDFSYSVLSGASATGGTITVDGDYTVHTFTSSGNFINSIDLTVDSLVVAGGGGGGGTQSGGGGGGGVIYNSSRSVTSGTYAVAVGAGGVGTLGSDVPGLNGGNSAFDGTTSIGGGGGGVYSTGGAGTGGSGGGGAAQSGIVNGDGIDGQGYDGGLGSALLNFGAGGGGGAGSEGASGTTSVGGDGGIGYRVEPGASISGTSTYYAGGGGGSVFTSGTPGAGVDGGGNGQLYSVGNPTDGVDNIGGGGGGGFDAKGGDGGDGVVIIRYLTPIADVIDPGIAVGDDKLYYDGTLSSTLTYSDGSAYIDSSDVSASMKGSLPIIKVGTTQNVKIDHDLQYSITYISKNMDITSPDMFRAGEDMRVDTRLTDTSGNPTSYQPLEMRARLFDSNDKQYLDEIVSSTSFVIPGKYLHDNKHYQLRLSYEGYEFGGWSNEALADFDIGTEGFTITSSPDKAPEGIAAASFAAVEGLVGMAVTGWLDVPIIGDIIRFIANLVGVEL